MPDKTPVVHYVPHPGSDYICVCGWDVQDLPDGHTYTLYRDDATCDICHGRND